MSKKIISGITLTLLLIGMLMLAFNVQPVKASGTIYIRADGSIDPPTAPIQRDGNVYTFTDNITNQTIVSERGSIVIDGNDYTLQGSGQGEGFYLCAQNITVQNTRITGFNIGIYWDDYSLQKIVNNEITHTGVAVYLHTMFGRDSIIGNTIVGNGIAVFMHGVDSSVDTINNTMIDNGAGIILSGWCGCWGGKIISNTIVNSGANGIELSEVWCLLRNNVLINSGLSVGGLSVDHYIQDIDVSNTINGKPIYYWIGEENKTVPQDAGYVALVSCKNMLVENLTLSGNGQGVVLAGTTGSTVRNLNILHNDAGFVLTGSSCNRIYSNNVTQCGIPVLGWDSEDNVVYHNNFIDNHYPPWIINSQDSWDAGYPLGGNYWSDYNGTDFYSGPYQNETRCDGIGDTPYIFEELGNERNYTDRYPLMNPWSSLPVHNINTGLGYATIQEALDALDTLDGHIIFVEAGTYWEHVVVNKSISLIGENKENTIIDGSRNGTVISVTSDYVSISGLTIQNGYHIPHITYGIKVGEWEDGCNNVTIHDNIISDNDMGIFVYYSSNSIVFDNLVFNNYRGIDIVLSNDNYIEGNSLFNNEVGVVIGSDANSNMIHNNEIYNNGFCGISLGWSTHNKIVGNMLSCNSEAGIRLDASNNNNIIGNHIASNRRCGVVLFGSNSNTVTGNGLIQNEWDGIALWYSNSNSIYHNNFLDNTKQAGSYSGSINIWDYGYPSGGNFWSDHVCTGNPSDGSQPYIIDANNIDHYPFQDPDGWLLHQLTVTSSPIADIIFTIDGVPHTTPHTEWLPESSYTLEMPEFHTVGDAKYYWDQWSDGNTSRSRTITMNETVTLTVYYTGPYYQLTVASSPITGVTFTVDGVPQTTPYTEWLLESSYILQMPETHNGYVWSHWLEDGDPNRTKMITLPRTTWTGVFVFAVQPYGPEAEFEAIPDTASTGESMKFDASASSPGWNGTHGMPITEYRWDFGDGNQTKTSTPIIYHSFSNEGICYVTLTVYAPNATPETDSTTKKVTIISIPIGGYSLPIKEYTAEKPLTLYLALIAILTVSFTIAKRRKKQQD